MKKTKIAIRVRMEKMLMSDVRLMREQTTKIMIFKIKVKKYRMLYKMIKSLCLVIRVSLRLWKHKENRSPEQILSIQSKRRNLKVNMQLLKNHSKSQ